MTSPRKVRYLVLMHARCLKRRTGFLIKFSGFVFSRHCSRTIASSLLQHLAPQPRLVIDLKQIDADVRHTTRNCLFHRVSPALRSLVRKSGDQVDVDVINPCTAQAFYLFLALLRRVQASDGSCLA